MVVNFFIVDNCVKKFEVSFFIKIFTTVNMLAILFKYFRSTFLKTSYWYVSVA